MLIITFQNVNADERKVDISMTETVTSRSSLDLNVSSDQVRAVGVSKKDSLRTVALKEDNSCQIHFFQSK